jgi:hypothetical protein
MTQLRELGLLRKHLASVRLRTAISHVKSGDINRARLNLIEASHLDPSLAHPYVILSKIAFWDGDLVNAEANITLAEQRGLSRDQSNAMRGAVIQLRERFESKHRARLRRRESVAGMWNAMYRVATNETNWLTPRMVATFVFLECLMLMLWSIQCTP